MINLELNPVVKAYLDGEAVTIKGIDAQMVSLALTRYNEKTGIAYELSSNISLQDLSNLNDTISNKALKTQALLSTSQVKAIQ